MKGGKKMVKVNLVFCKFNHIEQAKELEDLFNGVELELQKAKYGNGRLAIQLIDVPSGEPYATLTVNLPDAGLDDGEFFVKTWSENWNVANALMNQTDLFVDTFASVPTGFVEAQVWKFADPKTLDNMRQYGRKSLADKYGRR
jgi:hypothetical protein